MEIPSAHPVSHPVAERRRVRRARCRLALRRRGRGTASILLTLVLALAIPAGAAAKEETVESLGGDLKDAIRAKKDGDQLRISSQLAALGTPSAFETLAQLSLTGETYVLEQHATTILGGCRDAASRAAILGLLDAKKSPSFKTRILLLAVAEKMAADASGTAEAIGAINGAINDAHRAVTLTALQVIRRLKSPASLGPLVKALEARERRAQDRIYHDILRSLREITGLDLQASIDWKNYAEAVRTGQAPPVKKDSEGVTGVFRRPSFFSLSVDTDAVLFVIDISGSMTISDPEPDVATAAGGASDDGKEEEEEQTGVTVVVKTKKKKPAGGKAAAPRASPESRQRLARVKAELVRVLRSLPEQTRFGILSFSHELGWFGPPRSVHFASKAKKTEAEGWVNALQAVGATRTDLALADALATADIDTVYLLTDGAPKDERDQKIDIDPILSYTRYINRFVRCRINTISFQQIRDTKMKRFVRDLAAQNDGESVLLP